MQNYTKKTLQRLIVRRRPGFQSHGVLLAGPKTIHCALGRSGIGLKRGEGDGITPVGTFPLLYCLVRKDRVQVQHHHFDTNWIKPNDGWCDAVGDRNYNQAVTLPYDASHESLCREDHLYDIVIVMDYNISARMSTGGSAIFFHLAHENYRPTEGCVAISRKDMEWLLPRISSDTVMDIQ